MTLTRGREERRLRGLRLSLLKHLEDLLDRGADVLDRLAGPLSLLAERVGLSQPALSQHLAKLREDGLVATRRSGTTIHYRIDDPRVARLIATLHDIFCPA